MTNNKNPPDSPKTYQDAVMEEINHNYDGIMSNSQLINRTILSVAPIVTALTLTIDTANVNTALIQWIIIFLVIAFIITAISFVISTIKFLKDNNQYEKELKQYKKGPKKAKQPQSYSITSNKDKLYWTILTLHCIALLSFSTAVFLIPLSPNHQHKKEISMSNKNHKDKPQDNPTPGKTDPNRSVPPEDRIERGGIPRPIHVEPEHVKPEPEETPDNTEPDNPPSEEPEKE